MAYTPKTWVSGELITDPDLNALEIGLQDAAADADSALAQIAGMTGSQTGSVRFTAALTGSGLTIAQNAFTTYPLDTVTTNIGGGTYNLGSSIYTVPATGLYLCLGNIRIDDGAAARSTGIGIGTTNADGPHFHWDNMGGIQRSARQYTRLTSFASGDLVRMYIYSDGADFPLNSGELTLIRLA